MAESVWKNNPEAMPKEQAKPGNRQKLEHKRALTSTSKSQGVVAMLVKYFYLAKGPVITI